MSKEQEQPSKDGPFGMDLEKPETYFWSKITVWTQLPNTEAAKALASHSTETEQIIRRCLGLKPWNIVDVELWSARPDK